MRDKPKGGMSPSKKKKSTESRKLKTGEKLKDERTYETKKREKEGNGRIVKSKMKVDCQENHVAKLTVSQRQKIPKKEFGLPNEKKYPMPDKSHARNAKARASEMKNKGALSTSSKTKIDAKANKILGKKKN